MCISSGSGKKSQINIPVRDKKKHFTEKPINDSTY